MSLLGKKAKCTRISQLVADHLHSRKRGGSLVVETGFPTSLVDLFVKNCDRLKKSSNRKRYAYPDPVAPVSPSPLSLPPPKNSVNENLLSNSSSLASELMNPKQRRSCEVVVGNGVSCVESNVVLGGDGMTEDGVEVVNANRVFVAVLKIFFVLILALGTKKFTVGITVSAFLLFFIEYAGRRFCRLLKPYLEGKKRLRSMIKSILCLVRIKQDWLALEEEFSSSKARMGREEIVISGCSGSVVSHDLNAQTMEIEIVEPKSNLMPLVQETLSVKNNFYTQDKELDSKMGVIDREEDCRCEVSESKKGKSRKAKIKSKMKKLIPKKLRHSKKKWLDSKDKSDVCEELDGEQHELDDDDSNSLTLSSTMYDEVDVADAISNSGELLQGNVVIAAIGEEVETKLKRNSGYLVLFLIVLFGLVGGRILALVLLLLWCFLLKSGEK